MNTKLKLESHKPKNTNTNTNPATDLPCQPNTKATNTNPAIDFSCQPNTKATSTNPNISSSYPIYGFEEIHYSQLFVPVQIVSMLRLPICFGSTSFQSNKVSGEQNSEVLILFSTQSCSIKWSRRS